VLQLEAEILLDGLADHALVEGGVVRHERVLADELEETEQGVDWRLALDLRRAADAVQEMFSFALPRPA